MNEADIQHIEATLGITLPDDYRRMLAQYPFTADSWADLAMPADANHLIEINCDAPYWGCS